MIEKDKLIKDIYKEKFVIENIFPKDRLPIHYWHAEVINKCYEDLLLFDVTRLLTQKMYLEVAILKAIEFLEEDVFCGFRYDGELLEVLSQSNLKLLNNVQDIIKKILNSGLKEVDSFEWNDETERVHFTQLLENFLVNINAI